MNKKISDPISKNTQEISAVLQHTTSTLDSQRLSALQSDNSRLKQEYESIKNHLQNLTKNHLAFFETFQINFIEQEKALKAISDVTGQLEDEIVKRTSKVIEKQEYIEKLQNSIKSSAQMLKIEEEKREKSFQVPLILIFMVLAALMLYRMNSEMNEKLII
jgi:predicted nuclease with TOPRIM domain